jgi:hypothetical protein
MRFLQRNKSEELTVALQERARHEDVLNVYFSDLSIVQSGRALALGDRGEHLASNTVWRRINRRKRYPRENVSCAKTRPAQL